MDSAKDASVNLTPSKPIRDISLRQRLLVIDVMVPATVLFAFLGGWPFTLFVAGVIAVAAWEYWRMFTRGGYQPSLVVLLVFGVSAALMRQWWGLHHFDLWLGALVLVAMLVHIFLQQKGDLKAGSSLTLTIFGAIYIGWLGSFAISIRALEDGLLWTLLAFPVISLADSGAYVFGRLFGKHKMLPLVSPKKSWEGYIGGIVIGALGGWGLGALWHIASPAMMPLHGLILGLVISVLAPFGDFGESMIKRQFCIKDSSNILPGHGGIFDRIDSSLWAAILGYYLILWIR